MFSFREGVAEKKNGMSKRATCKVHVWPWDTNTREEHGMTSKPTPEITLTAKIERYSFFGSPGEYQKGI